jgi:hypothetical protein
MLKEVLNKTTAKAVATQAAEHAGKNHTGEGKAIDPKFGVKLFKDKRVPVGKKILALFLGFLAIFVADLLGISLATVLFPILAALDAVEFVSEGLEFTVGILAMSATLLPHLAPKPLVRQIREENSFNTVTATSETIGDAPEIPAKR